MGAKTLLRDCFRSVSSCRSHLARPYDGREFQPPLSPLFATHPQNAPLSLIIATLPETPSRNSFVCHTCDPLPFTPSAFCEGLTPSALSEGLTPTTTSCRLSLFLSANGACPAMVGVTSVLRKQVGRAPASPARANSIPHALLATLNRRSRSCRDCQLARQPLPAPAHSLSISIGNLLQDLFLCSGETYA